MVIVNRAPVLALWAAIVAEAMGHDEDAALTLGKALAGLNAQSKGRSLGIFGPGEARQGEAGRRAPEELASVPLLGRAIQVRRTGDGIRALASGRPIAPDAVRSYLSRAFGDDLAAVASAMRHLAASLEPEELSEGAYDLYVQFRPAIPPGKRGWGAKGALDPDAIRAMAS